MVTAVAWSQGGELLAVSDDKILSRFSGEGELFQKLVLPLATFITDMAILPTTSASTTTRPTQGPSGASGSNGSNDVIALACSDGSYRFFTKTGREEKKVEAHSGATTVVKWNLDGTALLTAGENHQQYYYYYYYYYCHHHRDESNVSQGKVVRKIVCFAMGMVVVVVAVVGH